MVEGKSDDSKLCYTFKYNSIHRFISYYHQIESALKTKPKNILEIGIGNKTVSNYLKQSEIDVVTCDINRKLNPDVIADIRKLPFENERFDCVLAFEIIEHIPFSDVLKALDELIRVSKKHVILSTYFNTAHFETAFRVSLPKWHRMFSFGIRIPYFFSKVKYNKKDGDHFWELGRRHYPVRRFRHLLRKRFVIKKEFKPMLYPNHIFFILEKRKNA